MHYDHLSDDEVIAFIDVRRGNERRTVAEIVALLAVVEQRRIHLARAFTSMFDDSSVRTSLRRTKLERQTAPDASASNDWGKRDTMRAASMRRFASFSVSPSPRRQNVADLLARAAGKTQLEVGMIVASLAPKPDVPPSITALSEQPTLAAGNGSVAEPCHPPLTPLSPGRYKVELTGDEALRAKIARALELTREENFSGDLLAMFDAALDVFIAHQEKKKRGKRDKTRRPRASKAPNDPAHVTAAVRREVFARDDEQCTFVGTNGARCPARATLEIDHEHPRARGGDGTLENLRVLCAPHNRYEAERVFGPAHVAKKIAERRARAAAKRREAVRAPVPAGDASIPSHAPDGIAETRAKVKAGLLRLGFRAKDVDAKLDAATEWARPLEDLMREAIGRLTS